MDSNSRSLPVEDPIRIVENLRDSTAHDQTTLPRSREQKAELDRRLNALELDAIPPLVHQVHV